MAVVGNNADPYSDKTGPEELVKRETKVVNLLRALLIVVLIVTAALFSFGSYKMTSKWEHQTYQKNFDVISLQLKSSFHATMAQVMWNAYIISVAASTSTNQGKAAPNITIPMFDKIPFAVIALNKVINIFFAPLLRGESDLRAWEAYAQQQLKQNDAEKVKAICHACGSPNLESVTPGLLVLTPVGSFTCRKSLLPSIATSATQ